MSTPRFKGNRSHKTNQVRVKCILKYILLITMVGLSYFGNTQILDNTNCDIFTNNNFFNEAFIKRNGIKTISAEISIKKELKPMVKTALFQQYDFDKYGRLTCILENNYASGGIIDTILTQFIYAGTHLTKKRMSDASGYYSYSYEYDDKGNMVKLTYAREENANKTKANFELGRLIEIYNETYEHIRTSENQTKKIIYNSQGKPYQQVINSYDEYGNLVEETYTLIVTKKGSKISYKYDAYHRPVEKLDVSNVTGKNELRYEYDYDEAGNILEERTFHNNIHKTTRQFLYDGRMLLSALLTQDEETKTIQIVKYSYTFD